MPDATYLDTGPIRDKSKELEEEASKLRRAADRLDKIERNEFILAEEDYGFPEASIGYIEGVTSLPGETFRINLENPAAVSSTRDIHVQGEGEYGLINARKWMEEQDSGKEPSEEDVDRKVSWILLPGLEAEVYRGEVAEEMLQNYGLSRKKYEQLFSE